VNSLILIKLKEQLDKFSTKQKVWFAAFSVMALSFMILLFVWANRPEYALLYSNLDAADTAKILDDLRGNNIPYKLGDGGSTLFVSKRDVYELRIKYAGQNLISSGAVGYELFDKNNLGLTDFMQKVNLKRALEGELSNTINRIETVRQSRVHLVLPEPSLFEDKQNEATASVVLKLRGSTALERKQVLGIANLVAASVEGLHAGNVTIMDTQGRVLTTRQQGDDAMGMTASQQELQQKTEKYLSDKAQSMLDKVLGENNSIVRVAAELNFEKVSRTTEQVDPDNSAVLSEEKNEETTTNTDTSLYQRANTITNYELNKVTEHFEGSTGAIKRLSVAVFVNDVIQGDGQPAVARSDEELQKITAIVKSAIGFTESRGDEVQVQHLAFDRSVAEREAQLMADMDKEDKMMKYVKIVLGILGVTVVLLVMRRMMKKLGLDEYLKVQRELLLTGSQQSAVADKKEQLEEQRRRHLIEEAKSKQDLQERVVREVRDFTGNEVDRTTRILRYWLVENEE